MAKYNREFLVPYISDVCSLHIAKQKLNRKIAELHKQVQECQISYAPARPELGNTENIGCGTVASILFGAFWFLGPIVARLVEGPPPDGMSFFVFIMMVFGGVILFLTIKSIVERKQHNDIVNSANSRALRRYQEECAEMEKENAARRALVPELQQRIAYYNQEYQKIEALLEKMYDANVIPLRYRDMYAAVYLYDWFIYGSSDDMDMALNTYVLEEIKDRLDVVIRNQATMILNQRCMIANQYKSLEMQEQYGEQMRQKLNEIHATQEEQLKYTEMIESDTSALVYLAGAEYLRDL